MINEFNEIMIGIRRGYFKYIGSGSCREVFDLGNGYVVKVAKNRAGNAQNECEYNISYYDASGLFAKVIDASDNFGLLIMEKGDRIYSISEIFRYFNVRSKRELFRLRELRNISRNYDLILGDLDKISSWGMIDGRPVIIDYGFTGEVSERYYY
jgi:hypothetical protein